MGHEFYMIDIQDEDEFLEHVGTDHTNPGEYTHTGSGRYHYGEGENAYQHITDFMSAYNKLKSEGLSNAEIAVGMGYFSIDKNGEIQPSTGRLKAALRVTKAERDAAKRSIAIDLENQGYSRAEIGKRLAYLNDGEPIGESSVRNLLKDTTKARTDKILNTADLLQSRLNEGYYVDIGTDALRAIDVSDDALKAAAMVLVNKGYKEVKIQVPQRTNPELKTTMKLLVPGDTKTADIYRNLDKVNSALPYDTISTDSEGNKKGLFHMEFPQSIDSKRVYIRYDEEGGSDYEGVIQLRRGVEDISLGNAHYAQVRIAVDNGYYMKGMAVYSDKIPDGYDIVYNTNKAQGTDKYKVFKPFKTYDNGEVDVNNPFGAALDIKYGQSHYTGKDGEDHLSVINKIRQEGQWNEWSKTLSSQFLSKQPEKFIEHQLDLTYSEKLDILDNIRSIDNPVVRRKMLNEFADDCDSSASSLKASAVPGQCTKVILPVPELKDTEVYAPTIPNGTRVALVRHPHGGIFEIPILTVNNKNKRAIDNLGTLKDAIGINAKTAAQLSGADFDGDTVIVLPLSKKVDVKNHEPYKELQEFNTKKAYPGYPGMKVIDPQTKQIEMGKISNLITDMTIQGAPEDELIRAVKHSMVVIDSEKHKLNYKLSFEENKIAELKEKYQGGKNKGVSTLISKAGHEVNIDKRKEGVFMTDPDTGKTKRVSVDPETGKKLYSDTGETEIVYKRHKKLDEKEPYIINANGRKVKNYRKDNKGKDIWEYDRDENNKLIPVKEVKKQQKATLMDLTDDAMTLSSGTRKEALYANYANKMKALANETRKEALIIKNPKVNESAKDLYSAEVASLTAKLNTARKNKPRERMAQTFASVVVKAQLAQNGYMSEDDKKKVRTQALAGARERYGASRTAIDITPREWEAIKANAISASSLDKILAYADDEKLKEVAMPKQQVVLSSAKQNRIKAMDNSGYTIAEIAKRLGVSPNTVMKYM